MAELPYRPKPSEYGQGTAPDYGPPKYIPEHPEHQGDVPEHHIDHECHCGPPKIESCGLPGKTQCRVKPKHVKECLERCKFEITKCYQPPCRPRARCPMTEEHKPEYGHKPEYASLLSKFKPGYGEDDFDLQINESLRIWPHCTVGKIWVGANKNYDSPLWTGTGVLVGCDLVLTSSHIAPWGLPGWWMRFAPGYSKGSYPFGSSFVVDIRGYDNPGAADDFVVCKLYKPLGDKCGWMGTEGWGSNHEYTREVWNLVGYSPIVDHGELQIFDGDEKVRHVRDEGQFKILDVQGTTWGWRGGVMWGWHHECPCVVGLLSGRRQELCIFINETWLGGLGMVELVSWARTNWE